MAICKAQCTTCGIVMDVDSTREAIVCPACATPLSVAKAIQVFTQSGQGSILEDGLKKANTFLKLKDWNKARAVFEDLSNQFPHDARTWLGIARSISQERENHGVDENTLNEIKSCIERARKLNVYIADNAWDVYLENEQDRIDTAKRVREQNRKKLQSEYDGLVTKAAVQLKYNEKQKHSKKNTRVGLGCTLLGLAIIMAALWHFIKIFHIIWVLAAAAPIGLIGLILLITGLCTKTKVISLPTEYVQDIQRAVDKIKASAERNGVHIDMSKPIRTTINRKRGK